MKSSAASIVRVRLSDIPPTLAAAAAICLVLAGCGSGNGVNAGASQVPAPDASGARSTGSARIRWEATPDPTVAGYRLYYGTATRSYEQPRGRGIGVGNVESYVADQLTVGRTYHFAVTAIDGAGGESEYSEEASYTVR